MDLLFVDIHGEKEKIFKVPVYVLPDFNDVILGRKGIFEMFKITFNQVKNEILFEK
ncbi:hypothetical protein HZA97_01895 [Candidatus Woesearchaeota archaeon]|nr:hypothetical protein [Candidatus Woesearchaeota archaeon]